MSGGTFDFQDRKLQDIAETLRDNPNIPYGTREAVCDILEIVGRVLHSIDYHISGDTEIEDWEQDIGESLEELSIICKEAELMRTGPRSHKQEEA